MTTQFSLILLRRFVCNSKLVEQKSEKICVGVSLLLNMGSSSVNLNDLIRFLNPGNIEYDGNFFLCALEFKIQWNPSCGATPFALKKWPFKGGGLLSGVEINTLMFISTLSSGLSREGGLVSGWPLKRGSTV